MRIKIAPDRRKELIAAIRAYFAENQDESIGDLKAGLLLDFFVQKLGPPVYNQGIKDAQAYFQARIEDLETEFFEPEDSR